MVVNSETKTTLLDLIVKDALMIGDFELSSGRRSNYLIDIKRVVLDPVGFSLIGSLLYEEASRAGVTAIGGVASGGIPLVCAVLAKAGMEEELYYSSCRLRGFWVSKEPKSHGTMSQIEGILYPEDRVLLIEDVLTTGASAVKAANAISEAWARVIEIVSVVDRIDNPCEGLAQFKRLSLFSFDEIIMAYRKIN